MPVKISKRWMLVLLIAAGEAACLVAALALFNLWQKHILRNIVHQRVKIVAEQNATQMAGMIDHMDLADLTPGSEDWTHLQMVVEQTHLPHEGFLCIIDALTGRILCHPSIHEDPTIADRSLRELEIRGRGWRRSVLEMGGREEPGHSSGLGRLPDEQHLIVVRDLPNLGAKLLVHHREAPIARVVNVYVRRVWTLGLAVAAVLVLATSVLTIWIVGHYENRLARANASLQQTVDRRSAALVRSRDAVIFGLAKLAESRDDETGRHLERICLYVEQLARYIANADPGLDDRWVQTVTATAALHDVGKVGVPDSILLKPGPLTEDERRIVRKHTFIGGDTLMEIRKRWGEDPYLAIAGQIIFGHHENWDGTGYPFGLRGSQIPMPARIVAVADVYDALRSSRSYKVAFTHEVARRMIVESRGKRFDPEVVDAFIAVESAFERVASEDQA